MENNLLNLLPHVSLAGLLSRTVLRLSLSAFLGGVIGLEREFKHRPAGLRTNMLICFGAAMFTILSEDLVGEGVGDHTRIASQIIPGIGFIGAGSILRDRGSVTGLTTAATIFVVAGVGMACGGGLYLPAIFATVLILLALQLLGWFERLFSLKPLIMHYSVETEKPADEIIGEINAVLDGLELNIQGMRISRLPGKQKIIFGVDATRADHQRLTDQFRQSGDLRGYQAVPGPEHE